VAELLAQRIDEGPGLVDAASGVHNRVAGVGVENVGRKIECEIETAWQTGFVNQCTGWKGLSKASASCAMEILSYVTA
jgi:hypothetical protein